MTKFSDVFPPASLATLGGVPLTSWRNGLVEMAKSRPYIPMIGAAADGFFDQSGIDVANSVNAAYDSTNKLYGNNDPYTVTLLHFDGTNGATTITDDVGKTYTASGGAKISTAQAVFGTASLLITANGDYVSTSASADFGFGTADFTVQGRYRPSSVSGNPNLFDTRTSNGNVTGVAAFLNNAKLVVYDGASGTVILTGTTTWTANGSFYDWEVSRVGGTLYLFVNGNLEGSVASTQNWGTSQPLVIGSNPGGATAGPGYHDEFRVRKVGGHTASYTSATTPFALSGASLDLRSATFSAGFTPTKGSLFFLLNPLNGGTINAASGGNLVASLSQNAGSAYTTMPLTLSGTTLAGYQIYEANNVALGGSGTQPKWRVQTSGGLGLQVRGAYFEEK